MLQRNTIGLRGEILGKTPTDPFQASELDANRRETDGLASEREREREREAGRGGVKMTEKGGGEREIMGKEGMRYVKERRERERGRARERERGKGAQERE